MTKKEKNKELQIDNVTDFKQCLEEQAKSKKQLMPASSIWDADKW